MTLAARRIAILGATGSIGALTLDVVAWQLPGLQAIFV